MKGSPVLRSLIALLASALAPLAAPATALAGPRIVFEVSLPFGCVAGTAPERDVVVTLRNPEGVLLARERTRAYEGRWQACLFPVPEPGQRITARSGDARRTVVMPLLVVRPDRVRDRVSGRAPAGAPIYLRVSHSGRSDFGSADRTFVVDSSGRFQIDFSHELDLIGEDWGVLVTHTEHGDRFEVQFQFPFMVVSKASNRVTGGGDLPSVPIELALFDRDVNLRAGGIASPSYWSYDRWGGELLSDEGLAVYPRTGDLVVASFADDARVRLPRTSLRADPRRNVVVGSCFPKASYEVVVDGEWYEGVTNREGRFRFYVSDPYDVYTTSEVHGWCRTRRGDRVFFPGVVERFP